MLHVNVSRKAYGNALIGRYDGCFEERYKEVYDDKAYHAKVWMYRRRWTPTLGVRRRQCTARERLEKYEEVEVSTLNTYITPKNSCTYYR